MPVFQRVRSATNARSRVVKIFKNNFRTRIILVSRKSVQNNKRFTKQTTSHKHSKQHQRITLLLSALYISKLRFKHSVRTTFCWLHVSFKKKNKTKRNTFYSVKKIE